MRTVRIIANITLDGVVQGPGGTDEDTEGGFERGGWAMPYFDPAVAEAIAAAQGRRFDLLMGRRTYDLFAGFWPDVTNDPIADGLNAARKYVATHRPETLAWGPAEGLGGDPAGRIDRIRATAGPDLVVWGSSSLRSMLLARGLVDEIVLFVCPVLLGSGKRFVAPGSAPLALDLVGTRRVSSAVHMNTYRPNQAAQIGGGKT